VKDKNFIRRIAVEILATLEKLSSYSIAVILAQGLLHKNFKI